MYGGNFRFLRYVALHFFEDRLASFFASTVCTCIHQSIRRIPRVQGGKCLAVARLWPVITRVSRRIVNLSGDTKT